MKCTHPVFVKGQDRPCGQCTACRLNYSAMWALRCVLESQDHKDNVFLTLTFDEQHLPEDKSVSKREMQNFMKRFRKSVSPAKVRFYLSGEYGSQKNRPHYHLLIFGIGVNHPVFEDLHWDMKFQGFWCKCKAWKDKHGKSIGNCFIGSVTIASAQYVAKYVMKKRKGKGSNKYYQDLGVEPEFCLSSRRPGIGLNYLKRQFEQLKRLGYISVEGKRFPIPRYFLQKMKEMDSDFKLWSELQSYIKQVKKNEEYSNLQDEFIDKYGIRYSKMLYHYLYDQLEQTAMNIERRMNLSKGALND